jgi:hypothetical protein|nr:hypothetical protein [Alteromonas macleodii]|tara:strand:- start:528 stop:680 length:153 start_codon:yes stop_codon:yes gene_type:complete
MTIQSLKHEALKNKDVKQEYDRLESEFTLIDSKKSLRRDKWHNKKRPFES